MIYWINKEFRNYYKNSANATGIRYKFYPYGSDFDKSTEKDIKKFVVFLRKNFYFPIRLNILFCDTQAFAHIIDNHTYYGAFYNTDDAKRKIYPRISIAAKVTKTNSLESILFTLAHEITHYYQWYFLEDDKRTNRSLEIEASKWSKQIVDLYFNDYLTVQ